MADKTAKELLQDAMAKHGLTIDAAFVPFSQSRNKAEKDDRGNPRYRLNWRVILKRNGKPILETDYSAGIAHCPGYKATKTPSHFVAKRFKKPSTAPGGWDYRYSTEREALEQYREAVSNAECETGRTMHLRVLWSDQPGNLFEIAPKGAPILPDPVDVLWSLTTDSDVIDYSTFEEWAENFGYDPDSRKGESIYRACLEIALKLRAGIGEAALQELREAGQDY